MNEYEIIGSTPLSDGYYMPAEFSAHQACIMIWPERPGSWPKGAKAARAAFANVIKAIAESEKVYVAAGEKGIASARAALAGQKNVEIFPAETDDAWARDIAPTFLAPNALANAGNPAPNALANAGNPAPGSLANGAKAAETKRKIRAVNWEFNAWGGQVDGLYASWEKDNAFAPYFAARYKFPYYNAAPFVLEGGSIHSDGEGTILVTETCLLSAGRNPALNRAQIEEKLKQYLGAQKILWLPHGIYQDETNEHVDNICAFLRPAEVVLAWTDNKNDPQYGLSKADYEYLLNVTDAKGRKLTIHKLPIPNIPICAAKEDIDDYIFEEGEDVREVGERFAASYVNFYFANHAVILPAFGGENEESDRRAVKMMQKLCPERKVIAIPARDILAGGGNIHCITQQIPK